MSSPSVPNSISNFQSLPAVSVPKKGPQNGPGYSPASPDQIEISPNAKEILQITRAERLENMSPEELLGMIHDLFGKFDLNEDGKVSWREAHSLGVDREVFDRYDSDGDGAVNLREEFAPTVLRDMRNAGLISVKQWAMSLKQLAGAGAVIGEMVDLFKRFDINNDMKVSAEEAKRFGVSEEIFKEWDANGDGSVAFLEEYATKVAQDFHEMGVFDRGEYGQLMERIQNAIQDQGESREERRPLVARRDEASRERKVRPDERALRLREGVEQWLRGRFLGHARRAELQELPIERK